MEINKIKTNEQLIEYLAEGHKVNYVFFWGHTAKDKSKVGKECFSQWYESEFTLDDVSYSTAEHYMMAEKARLFKDETALEKILASTQPAEAKKLGRTVKGYDEQSWRQHRFEIVCRANQAKFNQNIELKTFLINTKDSILVEASPYDKIWGIGMDVNHSDIKHPAKWRGLNLLGFALMVTREQLK